MQKVILSIALYSAIGLAVPVTNSQVAPNSGNPSKSEGSEKTEVPAKRPDSESGATTVEAVSAPTQAKIYGVVDLRPSYYHMTGKWDTENTTELGYMPNPNRLFSYTQYWNTNLYNPKAPGSDLGLVAQDGFFRYKMKNIWNSGDKTWSLTYDPRIYLPTDPSLRSNGLIAYTRHYLVLSKKISDNVTLSFMEIPFYYGYNRAGYQTADGKNKANPVYENREYVVLDVSLANGFIDVSLPILLNHQRTRAYLNADNSDRWVHTLWTWPEIDFNVAPHTAIGLSWESDNFIKKDFSGFDFNNGLELGEAQIVMRATL
jgi:hypothetical protein